MEPDHRVVWAMLLAGTLLTHCTASATSRQAPSDAGSGLLVASIVAADAGPVAADAAGDAQAPSDAAEVPDPATVAALAMTGLQVSPVPTNQLACRVRWDTNVLADSVVSYGAPALAVRARDDQPVLHHDVLVYGLHAQTTYTLRAKSTAPSGKSVVGADLAFTTAALPEGVQGALVDVAPANPNPLTWYLTSLHLGQPAMGVQLGYPAVAVAYDQSGQPVWYMQWGKSNQILARLAEDRAHVMLMCEETAGVFGLDGTPDWQWPMGFDLAGGGPLPYPKTGDPHHDMRLLANGHVAQIQFDVRNGVIGDRLVELDVKRNELWSWSTFDHLTPGADDWTHGNSVQFDSTGKYVLYSAHNLSSVLYIDRTTGNTVWTAGSNGSLKLQPGGNAQWFALQHDASLLPDGHLLLYDNGMPQRGYSRAVEYQIDPTTSTATQVWEYAGPANDRWYSAGEGSVQRLPDGNSLIAGPDYHDGYPAPLRVFVVDPAGNLVWRMGLPTFKNKNAVVYRAQAMVPQGLEVIGPGEAP